ncbi:hypothetical protein GH714_027489 [Hevea brasiliensis]|uniref:EF-hand domain-containing protein n=1 Tax=Hevea brasiliensis TaxID=3981 RepID=A0A6A6K774_HEVBR|nr:hypothetical protein GH714_027489 [Hevea brasiliensis]
MAISTVQRLSYQFNRLQSLSTFTKYVFVRSSASAATITISSSSAKVADRIVKLFAVDLDGKKREIVGLSGQTLLKALTNSGLIDPASHRLEEIDACSAECEVSIAQEWLNKLPPRSYDEEATSGFPMFDRNGDGKITRKESDSLQNLGIFITDKDLVQMIEKIDANGDGFVILTNSEDYMKR